MLFFLILSKILDNILNMMNLNRIGSFLILIGFVDLMVLLCLMTVFTVQTGAIPLYLLTSDTTSYIFLGIGVALSWNEVRQLRYNPLAILKYTLSTHYDSLIFLAILSGVFALATGFQPRLMLQAMIYVAIWMSGR